MSCFVVLSPLWLPAQVNPLSLAVEGRVDLRGSASVGALEKGVLAEGGGRVDRQVWLSEAEQPRTYTMQFGIARFAWNRYQIQFTPQQSGTVTLELKGPWEEVTPGSGNIYREDVLWDALVAQGTTVPNGSFESLSGSGVTAWSGGGSLLGSVEVPAVDGRRLAWSWHNSSLSTTLTVTGGVPVTLTFWARARVPAGFRDMAPVTDPNSAAHQALRRFMRGANFGNYLEAPPNTWGTIVYGPADFRLAKSEGFDHVRLPVAWHYYTGAGPGYALAGEIFEKVDVLVTNALEAGLGVILNFHHFDEFTSDPAGLTNKFHAIWDQVAAHFSNAPPAVAFELLNEPKDRATTWVMNPIYEHCIGRIRRTNPGRTLFIGPGQYNATVELSRLILPDDANLIATVHNYDPFLFTHQGATWAGTDVLSLQGVCFPGPPPVPLSAPAGLSSWARIWVDNYNRLPAELNPSSLLDAGDRLRRVRQWADHFGRPVHVGEFGCYETAEAASRLRFLGQLRELMDALGLGWAMWDWKAGFHYQLNGRPDPPGIREALFPSPTLRSLGPYTFECDGALAKCYVIHRAPALDLPILWQAIATQHLAQPKLSFTDGDPTPLRAAFYRVEWVK
jgi:endoglucanase